MSKEALCEQLGGISPSTLKQYIRELRNYYNAPLKNRRNEGYFYGDEGFELPGLWFNTEELEALIVLKILLDTLQPDILKETLAPIHAHMQKILERMAPDRIQQWYRLRILSIGNRPAPNNFPLIVQATLEQRRLRITYYSRKRNKTGARNISPQRLSRYRDNWYLDAWCHERRALRSFSLDCITEAKILETPCTKIDEAPLNKHYATSFGIFAGQPTHMAHLLFTPFRARWVKDECWHPQQKHRWHDDGSYELMLPYRDDRELIMEICKYATDVEVLEPLELRQKVAKILQQAALQYKGNKK